MRKVHKRMQSPTLELKGDTALQNAYNNIENGSFDIIIYNNAGERSRSQNDYYW